MNTKEVAEWLDTKPRTLRQFLRSTHSTFVPVGSGARYEFTENELPTLARRFDEWKQAGKPRPVTSQPTPRKLPTRKPDTPNHLDPQTKRDMEVWAEEGPVVIPDIRDPRVRRRALADARAAEDRLMLALMACGKHVFQDDMPRPSRKKNNA